MVLWTQVQTKILLMKNFNSYSNKVSYGCIIMFLCCSLNAQYTTTDSNNVDVPESYKVIDDYLNLLKLGYTEKEIYEDLGNVNFLIQNYKTSVFWYKKLMDLGEDNAMSESYRERYQYALRKAESVTTNTSNEKDWFATIRADYTLKKNTPAIKLATRSAGNYRELDFRRNSITSVPDDQVQLELLEETSFKSLKGGEFVSQHAYKPPIAVTADGNTAYFSKAVHVKPLYGIFSKKQLVHKIYKADKINGQWKNIKEVAVCPKYFSAIHPTVSDDGKRLFFASDMPGTYGKYDIYVATIQQNGTFGIAKNLGQKVNTEKNDLYPNIVGGTSLLFASDGHEGYGGLDIFAVEVASNGIGPSLNLGSPINSGEDDFSIFLMSEKGMGYVMSNRGKEKEAVSQVAFSYLGSMEHTLQQKRKYNLLRALNNNSKTDYSSTVFEEQ